MTLTPFQVKTNLKNPWDSGHWSVAVTYIYLKCVDSKLMNMFYLTMLASLILLIGRFLDFYIIFLIH